MNNLSELTPLIFLTISIYITAYNSKSRDKIPILHADEDSIASYSPYRIYNYLCKDRREIQDAIDNNNIEWFTHEKITKIFTNSYLKDLFPIVITKIANKVRESAVKNEELEENTNLREVPFIKIMSYWRDKVYSKIKIKLYKSQLVGAIYILHNVSIEMSTGSGKSLCAILGLILKHKLNNKKVVFLSINDTLLIRDAEILKKVIEGENITAAMVCQSFDYDKKIESYESNIILTTYSTLTFDYLTNVVSMRDKLLNIPFEDVVIDELDYALLDMAMVPHIISLPLAPNSEEDIAKIKAINDFVAENIHLNHFILSNNHIMLTPGGKDILHNEFINNNMSLAVVQNIWHKIYQCITARFTLIRGKDYIIKDGKILLIDKNDGRILESRQYNDGLQEAICVKEGMPIDFVTSSSIGLNYQVLFNQFDKICGMSGTLLSDQVELETIYGIELVRIESENIGNKTIYPAEYYMTRETKAKRIGQLIKDIKKKTNYIAPILVLCQDIHEINNINKHLEERNLKPDYILSAENQDEESMIISGIGQVNKLTLATPLLSRGTDIILGGVSGDSLDLNTILEMSYADRMKIIEYGGLHIINAAKGSTDRYDQQAFGRCGRQQNPGKVYQVYSLGDKYYRDNMEHLPSQLIKRDEDGRINNLDFTYLNDTINKNNESMAQVTRLDSYRIGWINLKFYTSLLAKKHAFFNEFDNKVKDGSVSIEKYELEVQNYAIRYKNILYSYATWLIRATCTSSCVSFLQQVVPSRIYLTEVYKKISMLNKYYDEFYKM